MAVPYVLTKGGNTRIEDLIGTPAPRISISVETWADNSQDAVTDVSVLVLQGDGNVESNDDFVFYNQPVARGGAVELITDAPETAARINIDLDALPASVDRIVIAASIDPDSESATTFGDVAGARMLVGVADDMESPVLTSELDGFTCERALVFGEVYRRGDEWKIRSVGQGYDGGLAALITQHGIDVDAEPADADGADSEDDSSESPQDSVDAAESAEPESATTPESEDKKVALTRRRKPVAKLPADWKSRTAPGLPIDKHPDGWHRARLFPTTGTRAGGEQEGRATAVLLSVMSAIPDLGKQITSLLGAPRGRVETYTEVRFAHSGADLRPDGLIRVTRGDKAWVALVEVKTGKGTLVADQVESYLKVAKAKGFDSVVTISPDVMPCAGDLPLQVDPKLTKSVKLQHLSWEEIATQAALLHSAESADRTQSRILEEFLQYSADPQSGMWPFNDMGRHWVKVRDAINTNTLSATDNGAKEICSKYDQLNRHLALQLTALTGQTVSSQIPSTRADATSRAKQLTDSGELFGSLRIPGATSPVFTNANLARLRISCSQSVSAPRTGRIPTKVSWLLRQLESAAPKLRITAHHAGSRTESTSVLLADAREDPSKLLPPNGKDIREFAVTAEAPMGSKRASSENSFVSAVVDLVNTFYIDVTQQLKAPRNI